MTLEEIMLQNLGPFEPERVRRLMLGVVEHLLALHAVGKIHGHVVPSHIEVTTDDRVAGLVPAPARVSAVTLGFQGSTDTMPSEHVWSLVYCAPEARAHTPQNTAADIYPLGVIAFQLLTRTLPSGPWQFRCPHCGYGYMRNAYACTGEGHPDCALYIPSLCRPDLEPGGLWDRLCFWATQHPDRRLPDAAAFRAALVSEAPPLPFRVGCRRLTVQHQPERGFFDAPLCFSPDGLRVRTVSEGGLLREWDRATGEEIRSLQLVCGQDMHVAAMAPSGDWLLTSGKGVTLWHVETESCQPIRLSEDLDLWWAAFSANGAFLVAKCDGGRVFVWEVAEGRPRLAWQINTGSDEYFAVCVSACGQRVFLRSEMPGRGALWTADAPDTPRWTVALDFDYYPYPGSSAFAPDGRTLAVADECVGRLLDVDTGALQATLEGHVHRIRAVAIAPQGRLVATCAKDGSARVWELATGREIARVHHVTEIGIDSLAFSPDGSCLVTASDYGTLRVWEIGKW